MTCGLPTIATCHGGPAEIIVDGVSGLHIDPYHSDKAADILVNFFDKCKADPTYWDNISQGGLQRIYEKYAIFSPAIYSAYINGHTLMNSCFDGNPHNVLVYLSSAVINILEMCLIIDVTYQRFHDGNT